MAIGQPVGAISSSPVCNHQHGKMRLTVPVVPEAACPGSLTPDVDPSSGAVLQMTT